MKCVIVLLVLSVVGIYAQGGYGGSSLGQGSGGHYNDHGHGHHHHPQQYVDYQSPPHYHFDYAVHDPKTHDEKVQHESRDAHHTKGMYSFMQPDGRRRIVEYEADKHGINYKVRYEGHAHHEEGRRHVEHHEPQHHYSHHGGN